MNEISELFWSSAPEEIMKGYKYIETKEQYICLICGAVFEQGIIYIQQDRMMEAKKAVQTHIAVEHNGVFEYLLSLNKKYTGLTEHQQNLLKHFKQGFSDKEIVQQQGGGSTSTIRNHRFTLKEREKQAKVFLAIMGLLGSKEEGSSKLQNVHRGATMIDERYAATEKERDEILQRYFYLDENQKKKLSELPTKQKRKLMVLQEIMKNMDADRRYTEKEINSILKDIFHDYVTIRRYLIEYGFMERELDCSSYWVKK